MRRLRFKLATLIWLLTLAAVVIGFRYRVHWLESQVAQLSDELATVKAVRLSQRLDSSTVERGLKADELQQQRRVENQLKTWEIPTPDRRPSGPGAALLLPRK